MNWDQVKIQRPVVQAEIRCTWGRIDEADLATIRGDRDSLTRMFAQRYGYEDSVAQQKVDAFVDQLPPIGRTQTRLTWFSRQLQRCWGRVNVPRRR